MTVPFEAVGERVLILAPEPIDESILHKSLATAKLHVEVCREAGELCDKIREGAGTVVLTDDAISQLTLPLLVQVLTEAPSWSDIPLFILHGRQGASPPLREDSAINQVGNVTYLERPLRIQTLLTGVRSALRARHQQHQVRDLLEQQRTAVQRLDLLADLASYLLLSDQPEEIAMRVFQRVGAHLGLKMYLCHLLDDQAQMLRLSSHLGASPELISLYERVELNTPLYGTVALQRKRIVEEDVQSATAPHLSSIKLAGVRAFACFPLLANTRLIGTLSFGIIRRDRFEPDELVILETVCNQVAVAIYRQRTEQALQDLNQLLERRVEERTKLLRDTNEQMEAFSYSVSHDLRAPLRAIRGFAQALIEDYHTSLDATGRDYLRRMSLGAERLDHLIQDLLQYSRLSRSTLTLEPVPLVEIVKKVLLQLESDIRTADAVIEIHPPLPVILAHAPTLEQVLVNLVANAIKFVPRGAQPRVSIAGNSEGQIGRLWVTDNGIGIAPAYHQRIFGVFERLHSDSEYPGTGIGLAIVAKGVTRMGGKAGVESTTNIGSRFWIELPLANTPSF